MNAMKNPIATIPSVDPTLDWSLGCGVGVV